MNISKKFEELVTKQLESFDCSMGVTHLVMYLASARKGSKASFEMIGQWPQIDRLLISIEDDPSLKVSSPNRRWYPLQENDILLGVLRVETDLNGGNWPVSLDHCGYTNVVSLLIFTYISSKSAGFIATIVKEQPIDLDPPP